MLTYTFTNKDIPLYEQVYQAIKSDIISGQLAPGTKLPSKRSFASHHGMSTITIQNAYDQLISEGYVYTLPKKGYYVAQIRGMTNRFVPSAHISYDIEIPKTECYEIDFSGNGVSSENFPFSI